MPPIEEINIDSVEAFLQEWNHIAEGSIVCIQNSNFQKAEISHDIINKIFDNDPKIGFVYTDFDLWDSNGIQISQFMDTSNIPDIPFFARKVGNINTDNLTNENLMGSIMHSFLQSGYSFEHVADPYFRLIA